MTTQTPSRIRNLMARTRKRIASLNVLQRQRAKRLREASKPKAPVRPKHREGLDYVSLPISEVKSLGARFVMRYLSTPGNPKNLDKAELNRLRAEKIAVGVVFEIDAGRARGSHARGVLDAGSADAQRRSLGMPSRNSDGTPVAVYTAVDFDATPAQVKEYLSGWRSVLGDRAGVYGGIDVVSYAMSHLDFAFGWQAFAWSEGRWFPGAQIQQYENTRDYDRDRTTAVHAGLWEAS